MATGKNKVDLRSALAAIMTASDILEGGGKSANEAKEELDSIIKELTIPQFLQACVDAAYDRPSAYWSLCARQRIFDETPELAMHAKSRKYGWPGDSAEAIAHMTKHFNPKDIRVLMHGVWST